MKHLIQFILIMIWATGFVLAKGFWSTLFCIIPFYSYYIVIQFIFLLTGIL